MDFIKIDDDILLNLNTLSACQVIPFSKRNGNPAVVFHLSTGVKIEKSSKDILGARLILEAVENEITREVIRRRDEILAKTLQKEN